MIEVDRESVGGEKRKCVYVCVGVCVCERERESESEQHCTLNQLTTFSPTKHVYFKLKEIFIFTSSIDKQVCIQIRYKMTIEKIRQI